MPYNDELTQEEIKALTDMDKTIDWQTRADDGDTRCFSTKDELLDWLYFDNQELDASDMFWLTELTSEQIKDFETIGDYLVNAHDRCFNLPSGEWVFVFE